MHSQVNRRLSESSKKLDIPHRSAEFEVRLKGEEKWEKGRTKKQCTREVRKIIWNKHKM